MLDRISFGHATFPQQEDNPYRRPSRKTEPPVKLKVFYLNDIHAQNSKMGSLWTAADTFTKSNKNDKSVDTFKLAAGDVLIGEDKPKNALWVNFLNAIGLDLCALGNHEMDDGEGGFSEQIKNAEYKYVLSNAKIGDQSPLAAKVKDGKIVSSCVLTQNGHEYGIVGATPVDLKNHLNPRTRLDNFEVDSLDETIDDVQAQVDELKRKGVNKIVLVSHLGFGNDQVLAQNTSGIDIIIGGHSHDLIKGITPDRNLLKSKSGEPVLITQAGKDGRNFGVLDVTFDSKGVIQSAQNDVQDTNSCPKNPFAEDAMDKYLGPAKPLGIFEDVEVPANVERNENPLADLVADAMKEKSGAQVAILNGESIRGKIQSGIVTSRDVEEVITFQNPVYKVKMSEKDLIDVLNFGAEHEVYQVSGLKYKVGKDKKVKDVVLENKDGTLTKLNSKNPSQDRTIIAVYDEYLLRGKHPCEALKIPDNKVLERYDWIEKDATKEYISNEQFIPIDMSKKERILEEV